MKCVVLPLLMVMVYTIGGIDGQSDTAIEMKANQQSCSLILVFSRKGGLENPKKINYRVTFVGHDYQSDTTMDAGIANETAVYTPGKSWSSKMNASVTWQVVNENGHIESNHTATLVLKGCANVTYDPHVTTFDGRRYTFQGVCWYTLIKDCVSQMPRFEVIAKFEPRDPLAEEIRSRATAVKIVIGGEVITMDRNNDVLVNGRNMPDTFELHSGPLEVSVDTVGSHTTVDIKDMLTLTWNGNQHGVGAELQGDLEGHLCGLLGDADGDPKNDLKMPNGDITKDSDEFGYSWKVDELRCD